MAEDSKAVAPPGFGGGLGDFTTESLVETAQKDGAGKGSATTETMRDAMGNERPKLERVDVKGHGANLFAFEHSDAKVPGEEGLVGVIVAFTRHNSWFGGKAFGESEAGKLPPCFSNDGEVVARNAKEAQASACSTCPRNRDARDRAARDQAFKRMDGPKGDPETGRDSVCNNYLSTAIALPGRDLPVRLRLTRSSFKQWAAYVQRIGTVEGRYLPHEVVTRIKLENRKGDFGEFSAAQFEFVGALPADMRPQFSEQRKVYTALLQFSAESDGQDGGDPSDDARDAMDKAKRDAAETEEAGL